MFNIASYEQHLYSKIQKRVFLRKKDITPELVKALTIFDKPITHSINITKQTLYKKYEELLDVSAKPKGTYINLWLLEQYGYKYCKTCALVKDINSFGIDISTNTGINRRCKECTNTTSSIWKKENRETVNNYQKIYYYNNIEEMRAKSLAYQKNHKPVVNAASARKRAAKLLATPKWLSNIQLADITVFYYAAKQIELDTGIKQHVDHIVPLQGNNVCGLHVPWNLQILPAVDNIRKSNKHFEDYSI